MIRALLVDDHPVVTCGIESMISATGDIEPAARATTGAQALDLLKKDRFDVVVLDIDLPDMSGIEVLREIKKRYRDLPVLMLSIYDEKVYAVRAIKAGAAGYVMKTSVSEMLVEAIRKVCEGGRYITATLAEQLATAVTKEGKRGSHEVLSTREFEVMKLLAEGKSVTNIARELEVGHQTISTYRRRILDKMGLNSNTEITHYCILTGLVELG